MELRRRLAMELARKLNHNYREEHPLRHLFWESTLRCNVNCRHCGSDCKQVSNVPDMPKEDFFKVLDSIACKINPGGVFITVSGGEPLMRNDLEECGRGITLRGFPWGLVTNGLFLSPERFERLLDAGLCSLALSLDGMQQNHNWLRRHPGSFEKAEKVIDMLVASKRIRRYDVVTCVHQRNYDELSQIYEYLLNKGVAEWRLFTIFPAGRARQDEVLQLPPEQFRGLLNFIRKVRKEERIRLNYSCEGFLGDYEGDVRDWMFRCTAGVTSGSVLIDGSIGACTSIRSNYSQGNIYEDDFMDVWEKRFGIFRNRDWMRKDQCANCSYWRYCEGNGFHLRDDKGNLLLCHLERLKI